MSDWADDVNKQEKEQANENLMSKVNAALSKGFLTSLKLF